MQHSYNSVMQQQTQALAMSQGLQTPPASPFYVPPPSANNTMTPTQGEPKRKRVQVPAACAQCKRAHAACSNTRPCDRCVRINQADACISSGGVARPPTKQDMVMEAQMGTFGLVNRGNHVIYADNEIVGAPTPPALAPSPNVPFNESDVSRFLFDENQDFSLAEFPSHFEALEGSGGTPESPTSIVNSSPVSPVPQQQQQPQHFQTTPNQHHQPPQHAFSASMMPTMMPTTPSPTQSPSQSLPSSPMFMRVPNPQLNLPPRTVGPSPAAVAATIAQQLNPTFMESTTYPHVVCEPQQHYPCHQNQQQQQQQQQQPQQQQPQQQQPQQQQPQQQQPQQQQQQQQQPQQQQPQHHQPQQQHPQQQQSIPQGPAAVNMPASVPTPDAVTHIPAYHNSTGVVTTGGNNMMEAMMNELLQQNKKMENMLLNLNTEMKTMKQEMTHLKSNGSSALMVSKTDRGIVPATAVWSVSDGLLLEHNEKFAQILDLMEVPKGYSMTNFFGGPCSKAASSRMHHHLENIQNYIYSKIFFYLIVFDKAHLNR